MVVVADVEKNSLAYKKGMRKGDVLISINGNGISDVLDYRFYLAEEKILVSFLRPEKCKQKTVKIKKKEYDDIGLLFETPLMDKKHTCKNGCVFCFIDQNPKGMRDTVYFKDDDSRLSFIHGNYITLTNLTDKDVARIVKMRFSPINISVHTTNPELRVRMMKNKNSGECLRYLREFKDAGLSMCAQIVLCRGLNDGEELLRTLSDLKEYAPEMTSVAVVPCGLTKHRDGLYPLSDFTPDEAAAVIDTVNAVGDRTLTELGTRMFYCADELYLKCNRPIPNAEYYEDYPQIENGVGLIRSFLDEFKLAFVNIEELKAALTEPRRVAVATGVAAYPTLKRCADALSLTSDLLTVDVYEIKNRFYGESITVSGLLTGCDIADALADIPEYDGLLLPASAVRRPECDFLCGMTVSELESRLGLKITLVENDGYSFIDAVFGIEI